MPNVFRETLTDMSLGIVDNVPPDQIPDNSVADAVNMVFDKRQQLRSRPGCSVLNPNHNLDNTNSSTIDGDDDAGKGPDGTTTADTVGSSQISYSSVSFTAGDVWTFSVYLKMPTTPPDEDAVSYYVQFEPTTSSEFFVSVELRPDATDGWIPKSTDDTNLNIVDSGIGEVVVDPDDSDFTWYQVYGSGVKDTTSTENLVVTISRGWYYDKFNGVYERGSSAGGGESTLAWGSCLVRGPFIQFRPLASYSDAVIADNYLTDRVTSLYQHRNSDGTSAVYATCGDQLFEYDSTNKFFDDITGALALPDDTLWQWVTFNGEAIGVNRSDTTAAKANPVVIPTPGGTPAALTGSPPKARYIAVFNDRVWVVDEDEPWKVHCSKLGDHEDWTETSVVIGAKEFEIGGGQDNFDITGLHVHQDILLVFKRHSIFALVPGSPNTDISQYTVRQLTNELGCLSGYTIRTILNDVIFLSNDGLVSLSNLSRTGSYEAALLTQNLDAFRDFDRGNAENAVATVCPVKSQYIISFRGQGAVYNDRTYVLDYSKFQEGNIGFTRCDGAWLAQAFANILDDSGSDCVLMGGAPSNGVALVWAKDGNGTTFTDGGQTYEQVVVTKAYAPQDIFVRKRFTHWGLYLQILQSSFRLGVTAKTDLTDTSTRTYTINESGQVTVGSKWDQAVWDTDAWADSDFVDVVFTHRRFVPAGTFSAEGNLVQLTLSPRAGDGYVFRGLLLKGEFLNDQQRGQG